MLIELEFMAGVGHHDEHVGSGGDAMYWLMPVGVVLGVFVVIAFEAVFGGRKKERVRQYLKVTGQSENALVEPMVEEKLHSMINSVENIVQFWSGGSLCNVNKDQLCKVYENLALVSALMLSVCVAFYTNSDSADYIYGMVACIANCTLWMGTLSAAFFAVVVHTCKTEDEVSMLIGLYGSHMMRVPLLLLIWGLAMLFLVFILYFKLNIDPYFHCSLCLGGCFIIAPLFFHALHRLGYVRNIVYAHYESRDRLGRTPSLCDLQNVLAEYIRSTREPGVLSLDKTEFLHFLDKQLHLRIGSVARSCAADLFDTHVKDELSKLRSAPAKSTWIDNSHPEPPSSVTHT